jgi:signal transduction histidine kinase/anti-sigma regulatory factor (Ser/Thr protein kinase)/ActR/RegA family two-component response regulator
MRVDLLTLPLHDDQDLLRARGRLRQIAGLLDLNTLEQTHLAIAVSEVARIAMACAGGGTLEILVDESAGQPLLLACITDHGPGIADVEGLLANRDRSSAGVGAGLIGAKRLMNFFSVDSGFDKGTSVMLGKALPARSTPFTPADGVQAMAALAMQPPIDATEDVKFQSQELLAALTESYADQAELARLSIELEQTNRGVIAIYAELDEKAKILERSTERLTQELAERIRLEAQLLQSQKMEAVGQLTGGVAHDFNNILMVILSNADALQEDENLAPDALERIEEIIKASERAADLTRSLLAFSRKLPLRPQSTNINELVLATGKFLRPTLGAQVEIQSLLAENLWTVNIDRAQFESALVNLCINARDAMPAGGLLLIETKNVTLDEDYIAQMADALPGPYAMVTVTDRGAGIPRDVLGKVFEPFFTTKDVGKGTGLGLSMVHGFVKQSGGHIGIYSEVGIGTVIKMYLPRIPGSHANDASEAARKMPRGSERILLVEDDAQVRDAVALQLTSLGYRIVHAADGAAGLAAFEGDARPYDLLLTDIIMPGKFSGKALADAVTRRWPGTRILFMSGYSETAIIHDGRLDPGVQLLTKPFRKIELAEAIRRSLDGTADTRH